jgi:hypothetical protein
MSKQTTNLILTDLGEHSSFDDHLCPRFQGCEGNTKAAGLRHRHSTPAINRSHARLG